MSESPSPVTSLPNGRKETQITGQNGFDQYQDDLANAFGFLRLDSDDPTAPRYSTAITPITLTPDDGGGQAPKTTKEPDFIDQHIKRISTKHAQALQSLTTSVPEYHSDFGCQSHASSPGNGMASGYTTATDNSNDGNNGLERAKPIKASSLHELVLEKLRDDSSSGIKYNNHTSIDERIQEIRLNILPGFSEFATPPEPDMDEYQGVWRPVHTTYYAPGQPLPEHLSSIEYPRLPYKKPATRKYIDHNQLWNEKFWLPCRTPTQRRLDNLPCTEGLRYQPSVRSNRSQDSIGRPRKRRESTLDRLEQRTTSELHQIGYEADGTGAAFKKIMGAHQRERDGILEGHLNKMFGLIEDRIVIEPELEPESESELEPEPMRTVDEVRQEEQKHRLQGRSSLCERISDKAC